MKIYPSRVGRVVESTVTLSVDLTVVPSGAPVPLFAS